MMNLSRLVPLCGLLGGLAGGCSRAGPAGEEGAPAPATEPPPSDAVTGDDIRRSPGQPIEQVLMNRFPGVIVTRTPNGSIAIRIRGSTSFRGGTEPLYVIDGVPIRAERGGALTGINPYDIESIEVLKDAAGTTMYGVRGANGVIVIKTKQSGQ